MDPSSLIFYLNGFRHNSLQASRLTTFLVGISDTASVFDMKYSSTVIRPGQETIILFPKKLPPHTLAGFDLSPHVSSLLGGRRRRNY
jgi:hypothetical protein